MTADIDLPGLAERVLARSAVTDDEREVIYNLLRSASAPDGVVAWRHKHPSHGETFSTVQLCQTDRERGWTETPLYAAPQSFTSGHIAGQREMQERCKAIALSPRFVGVDRVSVTKGPNWTEETGMGALVSSHARQIASAIASLPVAGEEIHESDGGGQVAPAKCSATGVHPTDTSCAAEPEVAPGPSDPSPASGGDAREAIRALRYLADNDRPQGGQSEFNTEHLLQIADDLSALTAGEKAAAVATKKTYIKPLRTIVEIDERYADKIRDLLNSTTPATSRDRLAMEALENAFGFLMGDDPQHRSGGHKNLDLRNEISAALQALGGSHE